MSIADKITRLQTARINISNSILSKGGTVTSGDGFEDFSTDIGTIPTATPIQIMTAAEMDAALTSTNVGKCYKYMGSDTGQYKQRALYVVNEVTGGTYLYQEGDEHTTWTGGLANKKDDGNHIYYSGVCDKLGDHIYMGDASYDYYQCRILYTQNKIDISTFKRIFIDFSMSMYTYWGGSSGLIDFILLDTIPSDSYLRYGDGWTCQRFTDYINLFTLSPTGSARSASIDRAVRSFDVDFSTYIPSGTSCYFGIRVAAPGSLADTCTANIYNIYFTT